MYYFVFGILYLLSLLPLPALYLLSRFCYVITFHVAGYRKEIVYKNLGFAFTEKTMEERKAIAKQFYKDFWDNWIESLKLMSISANSLRKRVGGDLEALDKAYARGSCYVLLGHQFNWEWANAFVALRGVNMLCVYSPLSNSIFNRLFLYIRSRFGSVLLPFNDMRRAILPFRNKQYMLALMADQSPPMPHKSYWLNFFNQPTAFLRGPERGAQLANLPVVFVALSRPKRGHYYLKSVLLTGNAGALAPGQLTEMYARELEVGIQDQPSLYLWSHNRWKLEWKEEYANAWIGKPEV